MRDQQILDDTTPLSRRAGMQRRLRQQRRLAPRHSLAGAVVALAVVMVGTYGFRASSVPVDPSISTIDLQRENGVFTATMVGDMMFGRFTEVAADRAGLHSLLADVKPLLTGDYVSGNLEQVVSDAVELPEADKLIHLRSGTWAVDALAEAGFTTVSLANNHAMDYGIPGLIDTIEALDEAGIHHAGAGRNLLEATEIDYQEFGDFTVATLSFTDAFVNGFIARAFQGGVLDAAEDTFGSMVVEANAKADFVIVNFHFGEEYDNGTTQRQREIVELASELGADIIIGHHAHVVLPVERVGNALVFFGLGNFVFDQGWSRTRESVIARYALNSDGSARVELIPIYIRDATPHVIEGAIGAYRRARIFQRVTSGSQTGLQWRQVGPVLVADFDHSSVFLEESEQPAGNDVPGFNPDDTSSEPGSTDPSSTDPSSTDPTGAATSTDPTSTDPTGTPGSTDPGVDQ